VALVIGYVWPTGKAIWTSFHGPLLIPGERRVDLRWVGLENYQSVFLEGRFEQPEGLWLAMSLALGPLLTLTVVAPLLAWAADRAGRPMRLAARLALTLPMVCFTPVGLSVAWALESGSRFPLADLPERFVDPGAASWSLRFIVWISLLGMVCGVGLILYLAALRGRRPHRSAWPAGLTVGAIAALAALAVAVQSFSYPFAARYSVSTSDYVPEHLNSPMAELYWQSTPLEIGTGSAIATLVLVPVMLLGLVAAVLVVATGLRIEVEPRPLTGASDQHRRRTLATILTVAGLVVLLVLALYGLWPWLARLGQSGQGTQAATLLTATWLPTLISTVVGVGLALVGGYAIGALRPLGRFSEVLLLPFGPWLFIGVGPLFHTRFEDSFLQPTEGFTNLIPPIWLVVPAMFLFTVLFRGLASQERAEGTGPALGRMLVRALPMVALVAAATWLVQSQSPVTGMTSTSRETMPEWVIGSTLAVDIDPDILPFGLVLPIPVILVCAVLLGVLQVLSLDRLAIRVGRAGPAAAPRPPVPAPMAPARMAPAGAAPAAAAPPFPPAGPPPHGPLPGPRQAQPQTPQAQQPPQP